MPIGMEPLDACEEELLKKLKVQRRRRSEEM